MPLTHWPVRIGESCRKRKREAANAVSIHAHAEPRRENPPGRNPLLAVMVAQKRYLPSLL
jgi:hypothetical protein